MTQLPAAIDADFAVQTFRKDANWMPKVGVGGILNAICLLLVGAVPQGGPWLLPVALAVWALVNGYLIRTAKKYQDDPAGKLPEWDTWGDLLFGGLTWVAVQFGWSVLAAIPITIAIIMSSIGLSMYSNSLITVTVLIATIGLTMLFVFLGTHLLVSYLLLNFAAEEKLSAGFNIPRVMIFLIRSPKRLLTAWVLAFQLQVMAFLVPAITVLGILLIPSTLFGAQLLGVAIMAQAWRACTEDEKYTRTQIAEK
jgi:uncharacterized membrane protein